MSSFSIAQWAEEDKPRDKLMAKGPAALSDSELLAILYFLCLMPIVHSRLHRTIIWHFYTLAYLPQQEKNKQV